MAVGVKATAVLVFTGVVAPLMGFGLWKLTGGRDAYGGGAFAILRDGRRSPKGREVDPAIQAAEVRQMLAAKAERQGARRAGPGRRGRVGAPPGGGRRSACGGP